MNDIVEAEENAVVFKNFLNNPNDLNNIPYTYKILKYGNKLGSGSDGSIFEVKCEGTNRLLAAKLICHKNDKINDRLKMIKELKGYNIIRIENLISKTVENKEYTMILMEKAILRDLGKLNNSYFFYNLLKLIYEPFDEQLGDNLLRFYSKQIIDGLETLNRYNYVHFDLKPENCLITFNLNVKLSDFSLLTKIDNSKEIIIPGETPGYLSREYYDRKTRSKSDLQKQDYFALGSTIFYLKYGEDMLDYEKFNDPLMNKDRITDILHNRIDYIKSRPFTNDDFKKFLLGLIQYNPDERPDFEYIYRDKWLNKDLENIKSIYKDNEADELKLLLELQKSDFLKMKEVEKNEKLTTHKKFKFKKKYRGKNKIF